MSLKAVRDNFVYIQLHFLKYPWKLKVTRKNVNNWLFIYTTNRDVFRGNFHPLRLHRWNIHISLLCHCTLFLINYLSHPTPRKVQVSSPVLFFFFVKKHIFFLSNNNTSVQLRTLFFYKYRIRSDHDITIALIDK